MIKKKKIPKHIWIKNCICGNSSNVLNNLLIIGEIGCFNVENYKNIRSIKTGDKVLFNVCYKFNNTILFTGDVVGNIKQWKIENNTLILENIKKSP